MAMKFAFPRRCPSLFVGDGYGEFGTQKLAQTASHTIVFLDDDGQIIPFSIQLVGFHEHFQGAELDADFAPFAKIFLNLYRSAVSFGLSAVIQMFSEDAAIFQVVLFLPAPDDTGYRFSRGFPHGQV